TPVHALSIRKSRFNPAAPGHVQWVQRNDEKWYRAEWVDYQFEQERSWQIGVPGNPAAPHGGQNRWAPVSIQDIYNVHNSNPKIDIHIPDVCGQEFYIPPRS
ncbi:hypothetical protein KIH27_18485, partial [Mycobacterium sp. M1]|nr:hypothetical protein [Mycolicibacter acidiphilus]